MADAGGTLGTLLGAGPGRGIGLMFVLIGLFAMAIAAIAWNVPRIQNLEVEVPDLELQPAAA